MSIQQVLDKNRIEIVERIRNGASTRQIAKDYKCNPGIIYMYLKSIGIDTFTKRSNNFGKVENRKEEIITLFNSGISCCQIAKQLNLSICTVCRWLKKWGYDTSRGAKLDKNKPTLKSRAQEAIQLYQSGLSMDKIAKLLGYSQGQISVLFDRYGIIIRPKNKYIFNEHFFDYIHDEATAYILGWWYSDGNVMPSGKCRITLKEDDGLEILPKIKEILQYDGPLKTKPARNNSMAQLELNIDRKYFADALIRLGCIPNKSLKLTFPTSDIVPTHLLHHFVRGYFDGAGSISGGVMIVGTLSFCKSLQSILPCEITNIYQRYKKRPSEKSSHQLFIGRKSEIVKFCNWLYKDATLFLSRKKNNFTQYGV